MTFTFPENFAIVGLPLFGAYAVNMWQSIRVMSARKKFGVEYPNLYASEGMTITITNADKKEETTTMTKENADAFNCIQRAHQNYLENLPLFGALTIFGAATTPKLTTCLASFWLVARVVYNLGYSKGPQGRIVGGICSSLSLLAIAVTTLVGGVKAVIA